MLLSLTLGFIAAIADIVGGLVLVRRNWEKRYLRYFVALGAGFMLAVAFDSGKPALFSELVAGPGACGLLRDPSAGAHHHAPFSFWRGDTPS